MQVKEQVKNLPLKPGVYLFKNAKGLIIYIGKAKELRKRVASYFSKKHFDKIALLVKEITGLDFILTDNEVEALILEAQLIRRHKPKYNIDLKESARYAYLKITNQPFPQLLTVRKRDKDNAQYFGPFTDGTARENSARLLRSIFKIRTCAAKLPKQVCLQYYLGNCEAPCVEKVSQSDYAKNIQAVADVIKGKTKKVVRQLEQEMKQLAAVKKYELAKIRRDQIRSLQKFKQRQKISLFKTYDEDIINWRKVGEHLYIHLFRVIKGELFEKQEFKLDMMGGVIESFIRQYYQTNKIPDILLIPNSLNEQALLQLYLTKLKGKEVKIKIPVRGRKKELLDLVYKNVILSNEQEDDRLVDLKRRLNLSGVPIVIECFDVSNLSGEYMVGSMVQFVGGKPNKSNYRKYKIKTVAGQNDVAAIAETVKRRITRLLKEKLTLPDLIVIDGGRGQLNSAWNILQILDVSVPIIGLAKKEEEIYRIKENRPLKISAKDPGLLLLQQIRDEAHRFAVKYHRTLRSRQFKI